MSYKTFIANQPDDHPPEMYQKMYEQYNFDYIGYFSDSFFKASMGEEWFQDRYNPVNIINIEQESAAWAVEESARFKRDLTERISEFLPACSLEPNMRHREAELVNEEYILSGKHLPGHENRSIYISSVHACCPKAVLKTAIINALTTQSSGNAAEVVEDVYDLNKPERIVVAQPVWSRSNLDKFER